MRASMLLGAVGVIGVAILLAMSLQSGKVNLYRGFHHPSPDELYIASFYGLGGGGAAGWAHEYVSIWPADSKFDESSYVLRMDYGYEVCLRWLSPNYLLIEYPVDAAVHEAKRETQIDEDRVYVTYETRPSRMGVFVDHGCDGRGGELGGATKPWDE